MKTSNKSFTSCDENSLTFTSENFADNPFFTLSGGLVRTFLQSQKHFGYKICPILLKNFTAGIRQENGTFDGLTGLMATNVSV